MLENNNLSFDMNTTLYNRMVIYAVDDLELKNPIVPIDVRNKNLSEFPSAFFNEIRKKPYVTE